MTYVDLFDITEKQRQVIYGTILGGSSIVKPKKGRNAYLSMRGGDLKWIKIKSQELLEFLPQNPLFEFNNYFRWHSICSPVFNEFYDLFYLNGEKIVREEILNSLQVIGLTVWFVDCGKIKDDKIVMNLNIKDKKNIERYFLDLDFKFKISNKIEFDEDSSKKFMKIIGESVPKSVLEAN